jgi:crotonobetainyl-CoA:carnitine CoA-transferase CaiB-like acyl-CoA transferase
MTPGLMEDILSKKEALKGIRVLDITRVILGPWAATLFAELGAEVIHVEIPGSGDTLIRPVAPQGHFPRNLSPGMMCANANKYFMAIDMHKPGGLDIIKKLAASCDIVIENFKPGTFDEWGVGYRQLREIKPDIIYMSMQGFGNWGSLANRPSYDAYAQGISGLAEITGFKDGMPIKASAWIGDFLGGTLGAFYAMGALFYRKKTSKGQFIDLSQAEVLLRCMDWTWIYNFLEGKKRERFGNRDMAIVPACIVRAADGFVALAGFGKEEFEGFCSAMHRTDLCEYKSIEKRLLNADKVYNAIEEWARDKKVGDILYLGERYGFAAARLLNAEELHKSIHFNERQAIWKFDDPLWGDLAYPFALQLEKTPGRIKWSMRPVGFDNEYVLRKILGFSSEDVHRLYREEVIGKWDEKLPWASPPPDWDGEKGLFFKE